MKWVRTYAFYGAWLVSLVGLFMSLYFSEILNYEPCHLCWYQRMALFPLALLLGVAVYRDDRRFVFYGLILAAVGEFFALYQVLEGYLPVLRNGILCGSVGDCAENVFTWFGFMTFPLLSAIGFALISALLWCSRPTRP
ncbi:MAG: disulfide bond formation protein B [Verrucomicrobiota bacterium]|nr:disulfide bond formation protein B [Verrucomicrobiota bacterium]